MKRVMGGPYGTSRDTPASAADLPGEGCSFSRDYWPVGAAGAAGSTGAAGVDGAVVPESPPVDVPVGAGVSGPVLVGAVVGPVVVVGADGSVGAVGTVVAAGTSVVGLPRLA
jgi:hypothetical protein